MVPSSRRMSPSFSLSPVFLSLVFCRVQLNLFLCCPFGDYEIDLVVESFSDEGSALQQRTAWEIENGPDEVKIELFQLFHTSDRS